jgi:hypothetical protein
LQAAIVNALSCPRQGIQAEFQVFPGVLRRFPARPGRH